MLSRHVDGPHFLLVFGRAAGKDGVLGGRAECIELAWGWMSRARSWGSWSGWPEPKLPALAVTLTWWVVGCSIQR